MANTKPCAVCGRPLNGLPARRVTCGHPRCRREYMRRRNKAVPSPPVFMDGPAADNNHAARERIARLLMGATNGGIPSTMAVLSVAKVTGETPAVVRSVWYSMNEPR